MAVPPIKSRFEPGWYTYRRYALRCPAACDHPTILGCEDAARVLGEHVTTCPNPGPTYAAGPPGAQRMIFEDIYMVMVA